MERVGWLAGPARQACRPLLRLLYRAEISGTQHVPLEGPAIIAANHRSFFDTPVIMLAAPRRVIFLGKAEYMDDWRTRYFFPAIGMVPIERDKAKASLAALSTAASLLEAGELVGIYPEGTRSRDGCLHRGHTGVAHLSITTGAPIVPAGLIGTDQVQPIGQSWPRPRGRLTVRFGEPIRPEAYRAGGRRRQRNHITEDVMAAIATMTDQTRSPDFSTGEPPLVRGGSESVYRVRRLRARDAGWEQAASGIVASASQRWDDARVGRVSGLRCRVTPDGDIGFEVELQLSTRLITSKSEKSP